MREQFTMREAFDVVDILLGIVAAVAVVAAAVREYLHARQTKATAALEQPTTKECAYHGTRVSECGAALYMDVAMSPDCCACAQFGPPALCVCPCVCHDIAQYLKGRFAEAMAKRVDADITALAARRTGTGKRRQSKTTSAATPRTRARTRKRR